MFKQSDQLDSINNKIDYVDALAGKHGADIEELAIDTISVRYEIEIKKGATNPEINKWSKPSKRNFAAIIFRIPNTEIEIKKSAGSLEKPISMKPGEWNKIKELSGHAERMVLSQAINQAIDSGWQPKGDDGNLLEKFKITPPSVDELKKYQGALKDITIILYTEMEPCLIKSKTNADINCTELFNEILLAENHKIYYSIDHAGSPKPQNDSKKRELKIKAALQNYWKINQQNTIIQQPISATHVTEQALNITTNVVIEEKKQKQKTVQKQVMKMLNINPKN